MVDLKFLAGENFEIPLLINMDSLYHFWLVQNTYYAVVSNLNSLNVSQFLGRISQFFHLCNFFENRKFVLFIDKNRRLEQEDNTK